MAAPANKKDPERTKTINTLYQTIPAKEKYSEYRQLFKDLSYENCLALRQEKSARVQRTMGDIAYSQIYQYLVRNA